MMDTGSIIKIFITLLAFFSSTWAFEYFGLSCFEQIIFHMKVPLEGANTTPFFDWVKICWSKTILATLCWIGICMIPAVHPYYRIAGRYFIYIMLIWAGHNVGLFEWCINQFRKTNIYEKYFVDPHTVDVEFPEQKRNLIWIYLESMETAYTSKENGGDYHDDLIPELSDLAKKYTNFSHQDKLGGAHVVAGTGWTTGGIVGSTAGTGLTIPFYARPLIGNRPFLKHAKTMGDILEEHGYNQELCIGSDATFGGRRAYFEQHGHFKIFDYISAKSKLPKHYRVFWGFEDEKLFAFAKDEITQLSKQGKPFNFSMLTVDTHHPKGYKDDFYKNEYPEQLSNIIRGSSKKVGAFVKWIQQQPFYENTTIVICGDHTSMAAEYIHKTYDKEYDRTTYNVIINGVKNTKHNKNRQFTNFDFFPTVLSALGADIPGHKLGFGRDLYSDEKTVPEQIGFKKFDLELRKQSRFYKKHFL